MLLVLGMSQLMNPQALLILNIKPTNITWNARLLVESSKMLNLHMFCNGALNPKLLLTKLAFVRLGIIVLVLQQMSTQGLGRAELSTTDVAGMTLNTKMHSFDVWLHGLPFLKLFVTQPTSRLTFCISNASTKVA